MLIKDFCSGNASIQCEGDEGESSFILSTNSKPNIVVCRGFCGWWRRALLCKRGQATWVGGDRYVQSINTRNQETSAFGMSQTSNAHSCFGWQNILYIQEIYWCREFCAGTRDWNFLKKIWSAWFFTLDLDCYGGCRSAELFNSWLPNRWICKKQRDFALHKYKLWMKRNPCLQCDERWVDFALVVFATNLSSPQPAKSVCDCPIDEVWWQSISIVRAWFRGWRNDPLHSHASCTWKCWPLWDVWHVAIIKY